MPKSIRVLLAIAAVCAVAVSASASAVASAAVPSGTLTAVEYTKLIQQLAAWKKVLHSKRGTFSELGATCELLPRSTALLASIRTNCDSIVGIDQALVGFFSDAARCAALQGVGTTTSTTPTGTTTTGTVTTTTGTTTTGTTTTGTTPTATIPGLSTLQLKVIACMEDEYVVIGRAAKAFYDAQAALRQQVLARNFVGRCLLTLAPRHSDLELIKRYVTTSEQLAADVVKLSKVLAGTLPATAVDGTKLNADAKAFSRAGVAVGHIKSPQNLAVCPHEKAAS